MKILNLPRLRWSFPATAFLLLAFGLALMIAMPTMPQRPDPALNGIDAVLDQVSQLSDSFMDRSGSRRHSLAALSQQGQQVRNRLQALGGLPGQAELAARLGHQFEQSFRHAMQARLAVADAPDDAVVAQAAAQPFFAALQADLQQERLAAQERWFDSAWDSRDAMHRALLLTSAVAALVASGLALLAWRSVRDFRALRRGRRGAAHPV